MQRSEHKPSSPNPIACGALYMITSTLPNESHLNGWILQHNRSMPPRWQCSHFQKNSRVLHMELPYQFLSDAKDLGFVACSPLNHYSPTTTRTLKSYQLLNMPFGPSYLRAYLEKWPNGTTHDHCASSQKK